MKISYILKLRYFLLVAWLLAMTYFLYFKIIPFGSIQYNGNLLEKNYFIANLTPPERIEDVEGQAGILGEPVYFSLQLPRHFNEATFRLRYKFLNDENNLLKIGLLADDKLWRYLEKPLENRTIEKALDVWESVQSEDGKLFLQKEKKFVNLKEYLDSDIERFDLGMYNLSDTNLDLPAFSLDKEKNSDKEEWLLPVPLRGDQQMFVYSFGEDISLNFKFFDLNENKNSDEIELSLYYQNKLLNSEFLEDDGDSSDKANVSKVKDFAWSLGYLPEGVYRAEIRSGSDIVVSEIKSSTNYIVFINKINIYKSEGKVTLKNNGSFLRAETIYPDYLQNFNFKNKEIKLEETYKQYYLKDLESKDIWEEIILEKGGLHLANDGIFVFENAKVFDPRYKSINQVTKLSELNYIIANYSPIKKDDSWNIAEAKFNLSEVWSKDNKYNVLLSIPGLNLVDKPAILIDNITVELKGTNIWKKIF